MAMQPFVINLNPKAKHGPKRTKKRNQSTGRSVLKHGPKHCFDILMCFGTLWSVLRVPKHSFGSPNPNPNVNPNPKTKHRPKHGPKQCFGTEAWTEAQTMFRSILKQCFGINYSMPLNRGIE